MKNPMNKKLHAFTLSETLMSMTILTFVVLVGFFAYQYIHQYFNAYRERSRELTILSESCFVLKHDIIYANYLYKEDSVLKVGDPGDTVKYSFFHSHFEKEKHGQSDTIPLKGLSFEDIAE